MGALNVWTSYFEYSEQALTNTCPFPPPLKQSTLAVTPFCLPCLSAVHTCPREVNIRCNISSRKGWKRIIDNYLSLGEMKSDPSSRSHGNMTFEIFINRSNNSETMQK